MLDPRITERGEGRCAVCNETKPETIRVQIMSLIWFIACHDCADSELRGIVEVWHDYEKARNLRNQLQLQLPLESLSTQQTETL